MSELQLHVPENEKLLELSGKAEQCQAQCNELLKGSITLEVCLETIFCREQHLE